MKFSTDEDMIPGGKADNAKVSDFDTKQLLKGIKVEFEHTNDFNVALEIAMDHLVEDPMYYDKLATIHKENKGSPTMKLSMVHVFSESVTGKEVEQLINKYASQLKDPAQKKDLIVRALHYLGAQSPIGSQDVDTLLGRATKSMTTPPPVPGAAKKPGERHPKPTKPVDQGGPGPSQDFSAMKADFPSTKMPSLASLAAGEKGAQTFAQQMGLPDFDNPKTGDVTFDGPEVSSDSPEADIPMASPADVKSVVPKKKSAAKSPGVEDQPPLRLRSAEKAAQQKALAAATKEPFKKTKSAAMEKKPASKPTKKQKVATTTDVPDLDKDTFSRLVHRKTGKFV